MSYLQRLVDRAAGHRDPVHTRSDPVFPPPAPQLADHRGGDSRPVALATPTPAASAEVPPTAVADETPAGEPAQATVRSDISLPQIPPSWAEPAPPPASVVPATPPSAADEAVAAKLEPPPPDEAPSPVGSPQVPSPPGNDVLNDAHGGAVVDLEHPTHGTSIIRPAEERPFDATVNRFDTVIEPTANDDVVTARPAPAAPAAHAIPAAGSFVTAARATPDLGDAAASAPVAPVDVHIDSIEIVTDGPAPTSAPAAAAVVTGFADYDAVRSYEWGD